MARKIDIRRASLPEFECFVFDHEVHSIGSDNTWYHDWGLEVDFDPDHNARRFTEMFLDAGGLPSKFSIPQLEQGCWAMFGAGFDGNLPDLIWNSAVSIEVKEALIASIYFLYRDLLSYKGLGDVAYQFWDGLAYEIHPMEIADPVHNLEHKRIQNTMFTTLSEILQLRSPSSQQGALHGLNHVRHPDTPVLIRQYVINNPMLTDSEVDYAALCANGRSL